MGFSYLLTFAGHHVTAGTLLLWTLLSVLRRETALSRQRLSVPLEAQRWEEGRAVVGPPLPASKNQCLPAIPEGASSCILEDK